MSTVYNVCTVRKELGLRKKQHFLKYTKELCYNLQSHRIKHSLYSNNLLLCFQSVKNKTWRLKEVELFLVLWSKH